MNTAAHCVMAVTPDGTEITVERGLDASELRRPRQLWSAGHPIVAFGYLALLESLHRSPLALRLLGDGRTIEDTEAPGFAVNDLLSQRAYLARPSLTEFQLLAPADMETLPARICASAFHRLPSRPAQPLRSELSLWWLLERSADHLLGTPGAFARWLGEELRVMLPRFRLWVRPERELLGLPAEAIGVPLGRHVDRLLPLLHGMTRRARALTSPTAGLFGEPVALAGFWKVVGDRLLRGSGSGALPSQCHLAEITGEDRHGNPYMWGALSIAADGLPASDDRDRPQRWIGHDGAGGSLAAAVDIETGAAWVGIGQELCRDKVRHQQQLRAIVATASDLLTAA